MAVVYHEISFPFLCAFLPLFALCADSVPGLQLPFLFSLTLLRFRLTIPTGIPAPSPALKAQTDSYNSLQYSQRIAAWRELGKVLFRSQGSTKQQTVLVSLNPPQPPFSKSTFLEWMKPRQPEWFFFLSDSKGNTELGRCLQVQILFFLSIIRNERSESNIFTRYFKNVWLHFSCQTWLYRHCIPPNDLQYFPRTEPSGEIFQVTAITQLWCMACLIQYAVQSK